MQLRYRYRIDPTPGQRQALLHGTRLYVAEVGELRVRWSRALPSVRLIRENQAVAVEDLCVAGLARTRLAKSVYDVGWAMFVRLLTEKAVQYGRTVVRVDRWTPTSQTCSACGVKDGPKPLNVRTWTCAACGVVHDRDANAARNVLVAAGLAETKNACGVDVRPPVRAAVGVEAGTRRGVA